jgi:hypothetical protein
MGWARGLLGLVRASFEARSRPRPPPVISRHDSSPPRPGSTIFSVTALAASESRRFRRRARTGAPHGEAGNSSASDTPTGPRRQSGSQRSLGTSLAGHLRLRTGCDTAGRAAGGPVSAGLGPWGPTCEQRAHGARRRCPPPASATGLACIATVRADWKTDNLSLPAHTRALAPPPASLPKRPR